MSLFKEPDNSEGEKLTILGTHLKYETLVYKSGVSNLWPTGRIRPAKVPYPDHSF